MKTASKRSVALSMALRSLAPLSLVVVGAFAATAALAATAENCRLYALTAVKQQIENEKRQCGFKGEEWSKDLKAQLAWCQSVPPEKWREMAEKRKKALESCQK